MPLVRSRYGGGAAPSLHPKTPLLPLPKSQHLSLKPPPQLKLSLLSRQYLQRRR